MGNFRRAAALVLAMALMAGGCQIGHTTNENMIRSSRHIGQARGFLVTAEDFFTGGQTTAEAQQTALTKMVSFAVENHMNTIFFEARPGATALYKSKLFSMDSRVAAGFDPLAFLCEKATQSDVQVFAVINPFCMAGSLPTGGKNPFEKLTVTGEWLDPAPPALAKLVAQDVAALVKSHGVAGVLLDGLDASFVQSGQVTNQVEALVTEVSKAARKENSAIAIGVGFDAVNEHNAMTVEAAQRLATAGSISLVAPNIGALLEAGYLPVLQSWTAAKLGTAELYTVNSNQAELPYELQNQLLANAMEGGVAGAILSPYSYLAACDKKETELLVSLLAAGNSKQKNTDLTFPQTLAITYPIGAEATVYDKSIYIMGTSDPAKPLTIADKTINRLGIKGAFGVMVELQEGANSITIAQGDKKATVKVNKATQSTTPKAIAKITTGTLFPTTDLGINSNETVAVACVGPSGASITATLNGVTAVLAQSATGKDGLPATFTGTLTLATDSYPADKVTNAGNITYVVSMGEAHEVQKSEGAVYVAGKNVPLVLEIDPDYYVCSVLTDVASDDNFTQSLKAGGRAAIVGRTKATRSGNPAIFYKLSSGGYVIGTRIKIVEEPGKCSSNITAITKTEGADFEEFAFAGGQPGVLADLAEGKLTLRFLDTKLTADPAAMAGGLVQSVEKKDTKDGFELVLTTAPGTLWGYDITHSGGATKLYLRRTPVVGTTFGKPLEGVEILLDPGHGGPDPGALGVAGTTGPTEAVLNMAVANAAKFRLEQLGATVSMTRVDESVRVSLDERNFQAQRERPHIFLAIHHNSTMLVKDLSDVRRMEAYYWEKQAAGFANSLMERLTATLGRNPTDPENAYYYVTRLTFAPAVLFEMGFVVNPAEYEDACTTASRLKAANGIAMAALDILP